MKYHVLKVFAGLCIGAAALITMALTPRKQAPGDGVPQLTSVDIGDAKKGSTTIINNGAGVTLQGYGTMFGMHNASDQGRFAYTKLKGDFDIIIQVQDIHSSGVAFTEGGLMARKDLTPSGLFVANFVTNNNYPGETDQYTFMFRVKQKGSIEPYWDMAIDGFWGERTKGNPAFGYAARGWNTTNTPQRNFPYVWLRLIRQGNTYKGYRRYGKAEDWGQWEKMSEITVDLGQEPLVGLALSANHHSLAKDNLGDPSSMSELTVMKITGLK